MLKSLKICKNHYYPIGDYNVLDVDLCEYCWDRRVKYYGEPLELPKTLREIIREGRNEQGDYINY